MTGDWQPIETAPRDGSWFVTCNADGSADEIEVGAYAPLMHGRFVENGDGLWRKEIVSICDWRGFNNFNRATHWMPLPALPSNNAEEKPRPLITRSEAR